MPNLINNSPSALPYITVVVPVYNEEYTLKTTLESLQSQDYQGRFDILVVDNASTDTSAEIARSMGVMVVSELRKGYVHAVRAGFGAAPGDIIACTDADTFNSKTWLSQIAHNLTVRGAVACSGSFLFNDGSKLIKFIGWAFGRLNWHLAGANMAVWKWAYQKVGGFNHDINLGADVEIGFRIKKLGKIIIDRKLISYTSSRRFQVAFWQTLFLYYCNDLWLILFRKPLFYEFPIIRIPQKIFKRQVPHLQWGLLTLILIISCSWFIERPGSDLLGTVMHQGSASLKTVALTFDNGPSPQTLQVLDILKRYSVKATFFMAGKEIVRYPDIARQVIIDGQDIGNHTFSNSIWSPIELSHQIDKELDSTSSLIQKTTGISTKLFRPPHGLRSPWMISQANKKGYTVILWNIAPNEWLYPDKNRIIRDVSKRVSPGSIILLNDGASSDAPPLAHQHTIAALPGIIENLQAQGYHFVTISELLVEEGYQQPASSAWAKFSFDSLISLTARIYEARPFKN